MGNLLCSIILESSAYVSGNGLIFLFLFLVRMSKRIYKLNTGISPISLMIFFREIIIIETTKVKVFR